MFKSFQATNLGVSQVKPESSATRGLNEQVECEVACVDCRSILATGMGWTKHEAAYDAGRGSLLASAHSQLGHTLRLSYRGAPNDAE